MAKRMARLISGVVGIGISISIASLVAGLTPVAAASTAQAEAARKTHTVQPGETLSYKLYIPPS